MKNCVICNREFSIDYATQDAAKKFQGWTLSKHHCSTWCASSAASRPFFFKATENDPDTVIMFLMEMAQFVFKRAMTRGEHEDAPYFLGHEFRETTPVLLVNEYLDTVDASWRYTPDEYRRLAELLNVLASKIRYGDRHAWT